MLRLIAFVFATLSMLVPAFYTYTDGHYRFGHQTWQELMFIDRWYGIAIWSICVIWFIYPYISKISYMLKN